LKNLILDGNALLKAEQERPLNIQEVSELIGLSVSRIYQLVSMSEIPVYKKRQRLYFDKKEILEWLKSGKRATIQEINEASDAFIQN